MACDGIKARFAKVGCNNYYYYNNNYKGDNRGAKGDDIHWQQ